MSDFDKEADLSVPFAVKLTVLLRSITLPGSFFVFVLYWGLIFNGTPKAISIFTHGVNFIVMALDTLMSRQPMRLVHILYFELYMLAYVSWSIIFHVAELEKPCDCSEDDDEPSKYGCEEKGPKSDADECRYIYPVLNWARTTRTAATILCCVLVCVLGPIFYLIFYGIILKIRRMATQDQAPTLSRQSTVDVAKENGCCAVMKYEMTCGRVSPTDPDWINNFAQSSFKGISDSTFYYLRAFWFAFMLGIMMWSLVHYSDTIDLWLIYLTDWTLLFEVIYLGSAFYSTHLAQKKFATLVSSPEDGL